MISVSTMKLISVANLEICIRNMHQNLQKQPFFKTFDQKKKHPLKRSNGPTKKKKNKKKKKKSNEKEALPLTLAAEKNIGSNRGQITIIYTIFTL